MLRQELSRSGLFDAFREVERMQRQLNRLFDGYYDSASEFPPVNVWTSEKAALITAELPGLSADDIDISVTNEIVTLKGSRKPDELNEGEVLHRRERGFGEFSRSIQLPFRVDAEKVEAKFKNGILEISLPRTEQDLPKKISVRTE